jgi:hypothetical protein
VPDAEVVCSHQGPGCPGTGEQNTRNALDRSALQKRRSHKATASASEQPATDRATDHRFLEGYRGGDGKDQGQLSSLALDLSAEVPTPGAILEVPAQVGAPQGASAQCRQLLSDLRTIGLASEAAGQEGFAGLENERLDLLARHL